MSTSPKGPWTTWTLHLVHAAVLIPRLLSIWYDKSEDTPNVSRDEKKNAVGHVGVYDANTVVDEEVTEEHAKGLGIEATAAELADAEEKIANMSLERCEVIMTEIRLMYQYDRNFLSHTLDSINEVLDNPEVTSPPTRRRMALSSTP
ncbi:hypothetical protein CcaverHIS002_0503960 [Cutaneotrichosporon cavernicola]|nr:hypothetical protein CcaverHIS002_0503960 [Cutaneotrichosporon cavernicola]